mmetsp:Transcript_1277/g.2078  ORF Transcript_1277/g.2078 Transcript_1277/m.2078 type:complete len:426 (+) Transcript_1277:65-1342(+)
MPYSFFESIFFGVPGVGLISSLLRFYVLFFCSIWFELRSKDFTVLSFHRVVVLTMLFIGFPALMVWNHVGFILDDILFPEWRNQPVVKPVFIVGNARSGTTWIHRLLVDLLEDRFTTMLTWEIVFAPSVTWRRLFLWCYDVDQQIGSPLYRAVCTFEKFLIGAGRGHKLHEVGLQMAEEDEWLMAHIGMAQLLCFFFPYGAAVLSPLISFDLPSPDSSAPTLCGSSRRMVLGFYRQCVQRHLYARRAGELVFLSKNPPFTLRIESIYATFQDCRVVCMLRDPVQSVPSMVSYISKVYHTFCSPHITYPNARELLQYCISHYQYPLEQLNSRKRPSYQWAFVKYHSLQTNLCGTLLELLNSLGILKPESKRNKNFYNALRKKLAAEQHSICHFKSTHRHSVQECCGMSESELKSILRVVYQAHQFE